MRMWLVDPYKMCSKHLLGEHVETHMMVGAINKNKSIDGLIKKGLIDTRLIKSRHDELAQEMKKRGYRHESELYYLDKLNIGSVNSHLSEIELKKRCINCRRRYSHE